jgi:hypothetical protein
MTEKSCAYKKESISGSEITHTYAICAYKESQYLEECVISLVNQSKKSKIIMCTSTPCDYIKGIAEKYDIPLYIREGKSDIKDDWNFAYNMADTEFVTIAHQDDVYDKEYGKELYDRISKIDNRKSIIMYLTDYLPLKDSTGVKRDVNSKIRRFLRIPLKCPALAGKKWIRKMTLAFGNSICCPSVTYNKKRLGESVFTSEYKFNIDWDTFLKLARKKGTFVYADKPLTHYRVHDGATSKEFIENNLRIDEDTRMFNQFWPRWVTKIIMIFYKKAYDTYSN